MTTLDPKTACAGTDRSDAKTETLVFHCTTCPSECLLSVEVEILAADEKPRVIHVTGNRCPRGAAFAEQEITCPQRILTSTVVVHGGDEALLPVRTTAPFDRSLHMQAMDVIRNVAVTAPVRMGDIVISNLLNTGVDLVASLDVEART